LTYKYNFTIFTPSKINVLSIINQFQSGRVPDKELLEALNTADICVNPGEYNEMNA